MSAPAANTRSPPYTTTARTSARVGRLLRGLADLLLHLHVERVHLGPVDPDGADAVLDLEAHELAHQNVIPRAAKRSLTSAAAAAPSRLSTVRYVAWAA